MFAEPGLVPVPEVTGLVWSRSLYVLLFPSFIFAWTAACLHPRVRTRVLQGTGTCRGTKTKTTCLVLGVQTRETRECDATDRYGVGVQLAGICVIVGWAGGLSLAMFVALKYVSRGLTFVFVGVVVVFLPPRTATKSVQ